ncbi:MAG: CHASE2 domain-containing protein [Candidatus Omnitrophota bacterium]|nr:CHASE2 domain-containing protein [Candidatus Omnitrophota bacterium]
MRRRDYLAFFLFSFVALNIFFFSHLFPITNFYLAIDDFTCQTFYIIAKNSHAADDIVLVSIDDFSLNKINQKWPFSRTLYAQALNIIAEEKARVIGLDVIFMGKGNDDDEDKNFLAALKKLSSKVVIGYFLEKEGSPIYPYHEFKENSTAAFINAPSDKDGVVRKLYTYVKTKDFFDFSWPIKIVAYFYDAVPKIENNIIHLPNKKIPISKYGIIDINYLVKPQDLKTISFYDLINKNFPSGILKDKIVLIGSTSKIIQDIHRTPLGEMPGVLIHVNVITDILNGNIYKPLPIFIFLLILVFSVFLTTRILLSFTFLRGFSLSLGVLLLLFWLNILLRFLGWSFSYGRITIFLLVYLILSYFYLYAKFFTLILKTKDAIIRDPLTNLFNLRYFRERLALDLKSILFRKKNLIVISLKGFMISSRGEDFDKFKSTWNKVYHSLFCVSNLWARYSEEVIVGATKKGFDAQGIKEGLENIIFEDGIKAQIKIGVLKIDSDINLATVLPFLIESLEKASQDIVFYAKNVLPSGIHTKTKSDDLFSSLYLDTEDKNRELLALIKKLKTEENRTENAYLQLVSSLVAALESKDPYTKGHTQRVCNYAFMLADKLNLPPGEKEKIRKAALLHDLGKIGIPDNILHKKGGLTDEEFSIIKEHEVTSAKILEPIKEFQDIIPYILYHHENFDGSGYPHGLAGEFIPLGARIIAIADIFDALTTGRDYKEAFPVAAAVNELERLEGKKIDPVLTNSFIEALKELHLFHA